MIRIFFASIIYGTILTTTFCFDLKHLRATGELRKACSKRGTPLQPPNRVNTTSRLADLRRIMQSSTELLDIPIDAFLVTSSNEHQNEYVEECDRRREFISGFSGSTAVAIITMRKAALWTDGRYHLQADDQLNCDWLLMRQGHYGVLDKTEWLIKELPKGGRVGADPKLISAGAWISMEEELRNASIEMVPLKINPIDKIWKDRPQRRSKDVFIWKMKYAGKDWKIKVTETRNQLRNLSADAMVITGLDEIAWLLNIRGRDIPYNPFVRSYVILSMTEIKIFVNRSQLTDNGIEHFFSEIGSTEHIVIIYDYEEIWDRLRTDLQAYKKVLLPTASTYTLGTSYAIYSLVPPSKRLFLPSPLIFLKAIKNPVEIAGMHKAHVRDAAAMCKFFAYLEQRFEAGDTFTELDVAKLLDEFRYEQLLSLGNSFRTIAAFGPNGALPHYEPTPNTNAQILDNNTLLLDSGGQYEDGTTDVTRTIHLGEPTQEQKAAYTRVLMGCIQLSTMIFPGDMPMSVADVMARAPLWEIGLDYLHGTGHGIGSFLGVHEDPISIYYNRHGTFGEQHFQPGYFFSVEPGYYKEYEFGIRLENILEVIEKPSLRHTSGKSYYAFKVVTLIPYDPKMIDFNLLSTRHKQWLNEYNERIRHLVGAELKKLNRMDAFYWMMEKTKYIPVNDARIFHQKYKTILIVTVLVQIFHFSKIY